MVESTGLELMLMDSNSYIGVDGREGRTEGAWDYIFIRLRTTMSSLKMSPMAQDYMSP